MIASVLPRIPAAQIFGALMAMGIISGALLSHVFVLGIVVQGDGGLLFGLGCVVFIFFYFNRIFTARKNSCAGPKILTTIED